MENESQKQVLFRLLVEVSQADIDCAAVSRLMHQMDNTGDNRLILSYAGAHGVLPFLYRALTKCTIPFPGGGDLLRRHYMHILKHNLLLSAELAEIAKYLSANGIAMMAFKGPTLSQEIYGNVAMRQFSDLDILIEADDLCRVYDLLLQSDYSPKNPKELCTNALWIEAAKDTLFQKKKNGILLEVHWKLVYDGFAKNDLHLVRSACRSHTVINDTAVPTMDRNVLLAYLCIHGSRHLWERLGWIVDIDRMIRKEEPDWAAAFAAAEHFKSRKMFLCGLALAHRFFQTPLPRTVHREIDAASLETIIQTLIPVMSRSLPKHSPLKQLLSRHAVYAALQDTYRQKIHYWLHLAFRRNHTAIAAEGAHTKRRSLTDPFRPLRLISKFVFRLV